MGLGDALTAAGFSLDNPCPDLCLPSAGGIKLMNPTLTDWRLPREPKFIRLCAPAILAAALLAGPAISYAAPADPAPEAAPAKVDPGTKKLTAAHGLFQRSLFKLAANEYTEF